MAADDFFQRWAEHNAERRRAPAHDVQLPVQPPVQHLAAISAKQKTDALPTLDDVAALTLESDYSPFVVRGVDQTVQRSALKKLFSDPHFNVMDGLDTYIDDYHNFEPIPPEMLALLNHAQDLLNPLGRLDSPQIERPSTGSIAPDKIPEDQAGQGSGAPPPFSESQQDRPDKPIAPSSDLGPAARAPASVPPPDSV